LFSIPAKIGEPHRQPVIADEWRDTATGTLVAMSDDERKGIRGDELADTASGAGEEAPEVDGGVRGDEGLAEDAGGTTPPHGDEAAETGIRGEGLADGAA
jgi:hypothetical protein